MSATSRPALRIGQGIDLHRFGDDLARPLVLGGVRFEGEPGLIGHSDADAVAHAVADALLGAAGLGDIGQRFPDTDPAFAGSDSVGLLRAVVAEVAAAGWQVVNVDCTVVAERPRLAPHVGRMGRILGEAVGAPVAVKGTRAEQMGALGRVEGVACVAVALLEQAGAAVAGVRGAPE